MPVNIHDSEYSELFWNIHQLGPEVDLRQHFAREFKDIFPHLIKTAVRTTNKMVRYSIYLYDPKSPLRKIKNIGDRRDYAAKLAGYGKKNEAKSVKEDVINGTDTQVALTCYCFVKNLDDLKYSQLIANEASFWMYYKKLMEPLPVNPTQTQMNLRTGYRKELKLIEEDINNIMMEMWGNDKEVVEIIREVRRMKTTPEHVAMGHVTH